MTCLFVIVGCGGNEDVDPKRLDLCHQTLRADLAGLQLSERVSLGQYRRFEVIHPATLHPPIASNSLVGYVLVGDLELVFGPGVVKARYTCQFQDEGLKATKFEHLYSEDIDNFASRFALESAQ